MDAKTTANGSGDPHGSYESEAFGYISLSGDDYITVQAYCTPASLMPEAADVLKAFKYEM